MAAELHPGRPSSTTRRRRRLERRLAFAIVAAGRAADRVKELRAQLATLDEEAES